MNEVFCAIAAAFFLATAPARASGVEGDRAEGDEAVIRSFLHNKSAFADKYGRDVSFVKIKDASSCADSNWQCAGWARRGECNANPGYMLRNCQRSCHHCGGGGPTRPSCKGINEPCWVNAQCCSARCSMNTYHCRPVGR
eukprot:gb/GFBE01034519.1/.p1 GENE.gb/GFBE01034519.1/~~gb/GFBE01034519.1/.p1  ORF type:complete len:140 (+),score=17.08 gb/GFBE01034519.1/:1-420(+)